MINNNISIQIEKMALQHDGSYKDAFIEFAHKNEMHDYYDLYDCLNENLKLKIRQEFIDKNYLPHLKKSSLFDFFK